MPRFGRGFIGRQDTPGRLGFEQPIPQPPSPPTAVTLPATGISATLATLNGTVNPNGLSTNVTFQWGTTIAYGNTTASQPAGSGTSSVPISQALTGFTQGQTYHYRIVATSSAGTTFGADQTWLAANPAPTIGQSAQGREPVVLASEKLNLRLIGPASKLWPGVASPPGEQLTVLGQTLCARPLPSSLLPDSADLVSGSYTTRLADAGESLWTFPNGVASDGLIWRSLFDPTGRLQWLEVWLGGELEQVVCLDTVNPDDGRGFASTSDATGFASSLRGNGAGIQNGSTGQLQGLVFDPATLQASLFDVQAWQDFSDAGFPELLDALLNSQLGLQLTPWQLLTADGSSGGSGQVVVHGQDGMFCLKNAYVRDWTTIQAPRDVIERSTKLWVPIVADNFPASSTIVGTTLTTPFTSWTIDDNNGGTTAIGASGGVVMNATSTSGSFSSIQTNAISTTAAAWSALCDVSYVNLAGGGNFVFNVSGANGTTWGVTVQQGSATFTGNSETLGTAQIAAATSYSLQLECDGEWCYGFVNGQLIGCGRVNGTGTSMTLLLLLESGAGEAIAGSVLLETLSPFLMAGSDKGDYALPGVQDTFPNGGLHARYFNNADLVGDPAALFKIHAPIRTIAYSGSGVSEYQNQQDAQINAQTLPSGLPQAWSAIWFGSVYLKLSAGNYTFTITLPSDLTNNYAVRAWIGETQFGTQLLDKWAFTNTFGQTYTFTVSASALAGSLPYGAGTIQRDGWYPIRIEYAALLKGIGPGPPVFKLTNSPAAYTDPGGTAIASGAQSTVVPATSLSPLGCVDQRYQGIAHFDLCQQTLQAYGYQASVEPKSLESGLFPGVLAPRIREGKDTDLILKPDTDARQDGQLLLRPEQANSWPLPGSITNMRWRPGDGLRVQDEQINVRDTSPRQILTFTRNLLPLGIGSSLASFANRPVTQAKVLKQQLYSATRQQRNYQRQTVTLTGSYQVLALAAGASSTTALSQISIVSLQPSDIVVRAQVRVNGNSSGDAFNLTVNNGGGPTGLSGAGLLIDITGFAVSDGNGQLYVGIHDAGSLGSTFSWQLLVEVLR